MNRSNEIKLKQVRVRACIGIRISAAKGSKALDWMAGSD